MADTKTVRWYDQHAAACCQLYESADCGEIHAVLRRWVRPGMRVLELGCGSGRDARFAVSLGARVTATDASAAMLEEAKRLGGGADYRLLAMPASREQLEEQGLAGGEEGAFDLVFSNAMIMHLTDAELFATARLIGRLVSERGIVILSFCSSHPAGDDRRYESRTAQSVRLLFEDCGFSCAEHLESSDGLGRTIAWHTLVLVRKSAPKSACERPQ